MIPPRDYICLFRARGEVHRTVEVVSLKVIWRKSTDKSKITAYSFAWLEYSINNARRRETLRGSQLTCNVVLSGNFATVYLREELCHTCPPEKTKSQVYQRKTLQKRKPRSVSGPVYIGEGIGFVKNISILSSYQTIFCIR